MGDPFLNYICHLFFRHCPEDFTTKLNGAGNESTAMHERAASVMYKVAGLIPENHL